MAQFKRNNPWCGKDLDVAQKDHGKKVFDIGSSRLAISRDSVEIDECAMNGFSRVDKY